MALKTSSGPPVFQVSESCLHIFKAPFLRDRPIARTTHTQGTSQTYIHTTSGNQTHDDNAPVAEDITLLTTPTHHNRHNSLSLKKECALFCSFPCEECFVVFISSRQREPVLVCIALP